MPVYEYHNTGEDDSVSIAGSDWRGQTFTPQATHILNQVKIYVHGEGGSPGTVTVGIRATSGGLPTGADLASGTFDGDLIGSPEWVTVTLSSGVPVSSGTTYAIVVRAPSGSGGNRLFWYCDTDDGYTRGTACNSDDSGATWYEDTGEDLLFEEWGTLSSTRFSSHSSIFKVHDGTSLQDITAYLTNVSGLPGTRDLVEVTTWGQDGRKFMAAPENVLLTLELHWSDDASVGADTVLGIIRTHGTALAFEYGPEGDDTGDIKYSGDCWVRDFRITGRVGAQVSGRCELQVEGAVSRGTF